MPPCLSTLLVACLAVPISAQDKVQSAPADGIAIAPDQKSARITAKASGIEAFDDVFTLCIDALRPDALRVRLYPSGHPAEDASWVVLPASCTARTPVSIS
jgi:alpha-glucosidase